MSEIDVDKDLEVLQTELNNIQTQLVSINAQREGLMSRAQHVAGAIAYLNGKTAPVAEEKEKPNEKSEEKSEA